MRKPFYVKTRNAWYVWHQGKQVRLGEGITEEAAWDRFKEIQGFRGTLRPTSNVTDLLEAFLAHVQSTKSEATYGWYQNFLTSFAKNIGSLSVSEITPYHVETWANKRYKDDSPSTRHGAMRSVQAAFNWAVKKKLLSHNPILGVEKPTPNRRETFINSINWSAMLAMEDQPDWRDFLIFMRETGCRVYEARQLEAAHFDPTHDRFILPRMQAKGKRTPAVIYCNDKTLEIAKRRMVEFPTGPIFRNTKKKPLTRNAIRCRFKTYGDGLCATLLRHTYITSALIGGADSVSVAVLCNHADPSMVAKQYQHLAQNPEYMKALARKVRS